MADQLPQTANDNLISPNTGDQQKPNAPTVPAKARSVVNETSTGNSNKNLTHVCDVTGEMRYSIAWVSFQIKELIEAVRQAVQSLWSSVVGSPFGNEQTLVAKTLQNMANQIKELVTKAQEVSGIIGQYIAELQKLANYIRSLPQRIAAQLTDCLAHVESSIIDAVKNSTSIVNNANIQTATQNLQTVTGQYQLNISGQTYNSYQVISKP
jgi:hypothetical protein